MTGLLINALVLGIGATAFMDIIALLQRRLFGTPSLNYAMVGRWLGHMPRGIFIHRPIGKSRPVRGEATLGWGAHYLIGVALAAVFLALAGADWLSRPTIMPALAFGVATVLIPFLVLQPGLGAGVAARKTPEPNTARLRSLLAHCSFGAGLWVTGLGGMLVLQGRGLL